MDADMAGDGGEMAKASTDGDWQKVYAILAVGGSLDDAADYLEIARSTLNLRLEKNPQFRKGVDRATAKGKLRLIKKVGKAQPWQAAAWMLERKWGKEFGKKLDVMSGGKPIKSYSDIDDGDDNP